ncbi:DUF3320 domain-containing protein [Mycobacterium sp. ITM-2016-00317]|uniref:DUF3320 domain-containing protein n=1 Tax=Mycobacterium sp. ITM-2016-00317 TaxID=2099694 RepID=UPI00287F5004|nr:DUF3320 domain-containing protein [Mycobacterium sp. ITM-2016-00317]WNG88504.1 DUF3320 domain-containing protein [Mycobacterium sp. ITM-2016-00317]
MPAARAQHLDIAPYREWTVRVSGDISVLDRLPAPSARSQVAMIAKDVIEAEAPIQPERLAKLIAAAFGLNRVNDDRRQAILRAVPLEYRREGDDFFWPADVNPISWRAVRSPDAGASRPIEEIGLIEIGNAMRVVAEDSGGADRTELKREALALFGGKRMTAAVTARLDAALERAFARGVLRESPSGLVVAD